VTLLISAKYLGALKENKRHIKPWMIRLEIKKSLQAQSLSVDMFRSFDKLFFVTLQYDVCVIR